MEGGSRVGCIGYKPSLRNPIESWLQDDAENLRVAELRGRIAELVREETVATLAMAGTTGGSESGAGSTQSEIGTIPPPAYEHAWLTLA